VGELVELATASFKRPLPRLIEPSLYLRLVHPLLVRAAPDERSRRALTRSEIFFPYFSMQVGFDDRRTRVALRGAGIEAAPLHSYFDRLIEFALAAEWGRRRVTRARATRGATPSFARVAHVPRARTSPSGGVRLVLAE